MMTTGTTTASGSRSRSEKKRTSQGTDAGAEKKKLVLEHLEYTLLRSKRVVPPDLVHVRLARDTSESWWDGRKKQWRLPFLRGDSLASSVSLLTLSPTFHTGTSTSKVPVLAASAVFVSRKKRTYVGDSEMEYLPSSELC